MARVGVAVPHATRVLDARIRCSPSTHLCGETEGNVEVVDKAEAARGFEVGFCPQLKLAREGRVQRATFLRSSKDYFFQLVQARAHVP